MFACAEAESASSVDTVLAAMPPCTGERRATAHTTANITPAANVRRRGNEPIPPELPVSTVDAWLGKVGSTSVMFSMSKSWYKAIAATVGSTML